MKYILKQDSNPYFTHQPVLHTLLSKTNGSILELGCGEGSTELIHKFSEKYNRKVVSIESDKQWAQRYIEKYTTNNHEFIVVEHSIDSWNKITDTMSNQHWDLIFIDQGIWEPRAYSFKKLKDKANYMILHDCDFFPENNMLGQSIEKYIDKNNRGKRNWDNEIKYSKEYFPIVFPGHTGPPTLLASNFNSCDIDVDFSKYEVEI
jgi:hypothetical protein